MGQNYPPFPDPQYGQQPAQGYPQQPGGYPQSEQWGQMPFQPEVSPDTYAPQGYPAGQFGPGGYYPGSYPTPSYAQPKKSRKGLLIGLVALLLVLIAGGVAFFILHNDPGDPQVVLQQFCNDAKSGNYHDAYQINSDNTRRLVAEAQYVQAIQTAFDAHQGVKDCQVSNVQIYGTSALGVITLTFNDGVTGSERDSLIQQDGTWKVDFSAPVN
jgi:Domain of unknown function (DUF4878)